ncbi:MAG TPA: hypothetical protein VFO11_05240, partial [Candidatus Polarisedimenticolaceae bacterium]|nr:hypothetical protein [Candidatus Polarisedimenticolaceae bacterium]
MLAVASLIAAVLVVLDDGEAVRGKDVRRDGEQVVITMEAGARLRLPLRRVVEIRPLPEEEEEESSHEAGGIVRAKPATLAGDPIDPSTPREQTAALGEPARFADSPVQIPPWPRSDWPSDPKKGNNFAPSFFKPGPRDPAWTATSGFPTGGARSARSTWARSPVSPEWHPADTWRAQRAMFGTSSMKPIAPSDEVETCWRRIVGGSAEGVQVALLAGRPWEALPIPLYEVERRADGRTQRTIFSVEGGVCRPIAGDIPATKDTFFEAETSIRSYNRAVAAAIRPLPLGEPVARALALATLADPAAMGPHRDRVVLLGAGADLDRLAANEPLRCELSPAARRKVHTLARGAVAPPRVQTDAVTFWTWSPRGGVLARHVVRVSTAGA